MNLNTAQESDKCPIKKKQKRKILNTSFSLYLRLVNFQLFSNIIIIINLKPDAANTVLVINQYN